MGQGLPVPKQYCCVDCETGEGEPQALVIKADVDAMSEFYAMNVQPGGVVLSVTLHRDPGESLGMDLDYHPEREALPVLGVTHGAALAWNEKHPDAAILAGDRVVEVNGARMNAQAMVNAIWEQTSKVHLKVVRLPDAAEDFDDLEFVAYYEEQIEKLAPGRSEPAAGGQPPVVLAIEDRGDPGDGAEELGSGPTLFESRDSFELPAKKIQKAQALEVHPGRFAQVQATDGLSSQDAENVEGALKEALENLPAPWQPIWSRSKGKYYFYNKETGKTTWIKPLELRSLPR